MPVAAFYMLRAVLKPVCRCEWRSIVTSLVCSVAAAGHANAASVLAVSLPEIPTGASFEFRGSAQKGSGLISCSRCLSSLYPWTFLDFPWKESPSRLPFSYVPFPFQPAARRTNNQFRFVRERAGGLERKVLRPPELLQGTAGAMGHPSGHGRRPAVSHRHAGTWAMKTIRKSLSCVGDVLAAEPSALFPVLPPRRDGLVFLSLRSPTPS